MCWAADVNGFGSESWRHIMSIMECRRAHSMYMIAGRMESTFVEPLRNWPFDLGVMWEVTCSVFVKHMS